MAEEARPLRDPLADLRERLEATREAAEQLAGEAASAARAEREGEDPGPGWRTAEEREALRDDAASLASTLATLSELIPPELRAQLGEVLRQVLLLVRALIDWIVERLPQTRGRRAGGRGHPGQVGRGPRRTLRPWPRAPDHVDPDRLAGELRDHPRARLQRHRDEGAPPPPGARDGARRPDRLLPDEDREVRRLGAHHLGAVRGPRAALARASRAAPTPTRGASTPSRS